MKKENSESEREHAREASVKRSKKNIWKPLTAILVVALLIVVVYSFMATKSELEEKEEETSGSITFTKTGAFVSLDESVYVKTVKVTDVSGSEIAAKSVNGNSKDIFVDFNWVANQKYTIEVELKDSTWSRSVYGSTTMSPIKLGEKKLENIEDVAMGQMDTVENNAGGGCEISNDGLYAAFGTDAGRVFMVDLETRETMWDYEIAEATIANMVFSSDGNTFLVGEESPDKYIYAFDRESGSVKWSYKTADDLGYPETDGGKRSSQWVWLDVDKNNRVYATSCLLTQVRVSGVTTFTQVESRVYSFNAETGENIWKYPADKNSDKFITQVSVSDDGSSLIFGGVYPGGDGDHELVKYAGGLDGKTGKKLWDWDYNTKWYWGGRRGWRCIEMSPSGKYVLIFDQWGTAFVYDNQKLTEAGKNTPVHIYYNNSADPGLVAPMWVEEVTTPINVSGDWLATSAGNGVLITDNYVILTLTSSRNLYVYGVPAPARHPDENTLFVFDTSSGDLLWKWVLGAASGNMKGMDLSDDERYLVVPVIQNFNSQDATIHGVYLFDLEKEGPAANKFIWHYQTEGICLDASISDDYKNIVAVEAPVDMDLDAEIEDVWGQYRAIFLT